MQYVRCYIYIMYNTPIFTHDTQYKIIYNIAIYLVRVCVYVCVCVPTYIIVCDLF